MQLDDPWEICTGNSLSADNDPRLSAIYAIHISSSELWKIISCFDISSSFEDLDPSQTIESYMLKAQQSYKQLVHACSVACSICILTKPQLKAP